MTVCFCALNPTGNDNVHALYSHVLLSVRSGERKSLISGVDASSRRIRFPLRVRYRSLSGFQSVLSLLKFTDISRNVCKLVLTCRPTTIYCLGDRFLLSRVLRSARPLSASPSFIFLSRTKRLIGVRIGGGKFSQMQKCGLSWFSEEGRSEGREGCCGS